MRVLLIAPTMEIVGGHSIQADQLLRAFEGDSEVQLRLCPINPAIPRAIRRIPYVRTVVNALVYYAALVRSVFASDVIHAFTSSFWGYTLWIIPAIFLARVFGRRIIVNYHDGRAEQHLRTWRSAVTTLKLADAIVVPSQYLVGVFQSFGLHVEAIPNAVDLATFRYRERSLIRPVFLTNRGFEALYNVDCTLRAFRLIQDRCPDARFTVGNDGPLRRDLEALSRELGLRDITFTGAVSQARMAELYDHADIYVMSPLIDNMPITVLECFASGVPVVSTAVGGVPHIAEHERTALLVPPGSSDELAAACFRLLGEPGLGAGLAQEGHRECIERYSVPAVREQWSRCYRRVSEFAGQSSSHQPGRP